MIKVFGFNCDGNVCKNDYSSTDYNDNSYFSYGYNYTFDFDDKVFVMGYYEFAQQNGNVLSNTGGKSCTYYWENAVAFTKSTTGNGNFEYNCNTNEISLSSSFNLGINDNCKSLNVNDKYYQSFYQQCSNLEHYCNECSVRYYEYINY